MKVLVTGGAGYVGSAVSRHLLAQGHAVRVLDSLNFGGEALAEFYLDDGFDFVHGDICSHDDVKQSMEGIEAVVHLAAIVGDPACARQPDLARQVNQHASVRLFEEAMQRKVQRFIFASTCSNYGRMEDARKPIDEDGELRPISLYAETKVGVERFLFSRPEDCGPKTTVLRFATVFGISPRMRFDLTVNEFTKELVTKGRLSVFGEQFWRPYVHVRDIASAIGLVLHSDPQRVHRGVFNVGSNSQNFTKGQLVEKILAAVGSGEVQRVHRDEDPRDYRVDFSRLERELGFNATRTVDDGVREVIHALRAGVFRDPEDPRYRN